MSVNKWYKTFKKDLKRRFKDQKNVSKAEILKFYTEWEEEKIDKGELSPAVSEMLERMVADI